MNNVIKMKRTGINSAMRKKLERDAARINRREVALIVRNLIITASVMMVWYAATVFLLSQ